MWLMGFSAKSSGIFPFFYTMHQDGERMGSWVSWGEDGEVSPVGSLLYDLITERGEDFVLARGRDGCSISPPAEIPQGFWPNLPRENQSRSWVLLPPLHPLGQGNGHVLKPSWGCTKQPEEAGRSWDGAPLFPCASGEQIKGTSL